jgi:hypothetical protein
MTQSTLLLAVFMASTMLAGTAYAAAGGTAQPAAGSVHAPLADKDFGKLSTDGASAFNDVHLARLAIFDGRTDEAVKLIDNAQKSLVKASADDTVFVKAESEIWSSAKTAPAQQAKPATSTVPISWIPIDSDLVLGESYQPTPEKAAAVVDAKKSMQGGDSSKALQAIRLAAVDIDYTVAVAPLKQSVADVNEAAGFVASHDFYGASQSLKKAEDGVRYDEFDDVANVSGKATAAK